MKNLQNCVLHLALFLIFKCLFADRCTTTKYVNPMVAYYGSEEVAFSMKNRCMLYPRCLLFNCCNETLIDSVNKYYSDSSSCIDFVKAGCSNCGLSSSISHRLNSLWVTNVTITKEMVNNGIANFPPTSAKEFKRLRKRTELSTSQPLSDFKVLYLNQGPEKSKLEQCASQISDMIFLNYKIPQDGDIYFPGSNFSYGRMALYWAARMLEVHQGWLYNYYVFIDDDVDWGSANLTHYEDFLRTWQPAVGVPAYIPGKYPRYDIQSIGFHDYIFVAYNREAVETLLPFVIQHEQFGCQYSAQYMNNLETNIIYRNHILAFKELPIWNGQHRKQAVANCGSIFPLVMQEHIQTIPTVLRHCAYVKEKLHPSNMHPALGAIVGDKRHKILPYDLQSLASRTSHNNISSNNHVEVVRVLPYAMVEQKDCGHGPDDWDQSKVHCCSLDSKQMGEKQ